MSKILKTTLASAFAIASIAGASIAFAADNGGKSNAGSGNDSNKSHTMGKKPKKNDCATSSGTKAKDIKANCTK